MFLVSNQSHEGAIWPAERRSSVTSGFYHLINQAVRVSTAGDLFSSVWSLYVARPRAWGRDPAGGGRFNCIGSRGAHNTPLRIFPPMAPNFTTNYIQTANIRRYTEVGGVSTLHYCQWQSCCKVPKLYNNPRQPIYLYPADVETMP